MSYAGGHEVVVTGGLGFIGSHVVDALLAAGRRVVVIDSMEAAVTDGAEYERHPACVVWRESISEYFDRGRDFAGADRVIHAASPVGPAGILQRQGRLGNDIVTSTQLVVEGCLDAGAALCSFSSAEVYGRSGLLSETDEVVVPARHNARLEYAIAKRLTETIAINSRHRGLVATVVRPFNVTGARQSRAGGFVLPTFVQQALADEPLTVFAGGTQIRAFLSARDLTRFVVDHLDDALAHGAPVFNLGNAGNATSIWALAERVVRLLGSASPIEHHDARAIHGPLYEEAESLEKLPVAGAAAEIGWRPQVSLDELIEETAAFYRRHRDVRAERSSRAASGVA
jgi:nucleoside-diphosphate-sugar epimerase